MGLKSDKWIRQMATEHGMIFPFEATQMRSIDVETEAYRRASGEKPFNGPRTESKRVISYGTSSYGYDVRCAEDFKIFTNINSSVVDPKNFDPKSFVDVKANAEGYVLVPPNSFALARTVERMKIPPNVLTVCVGKSTYARCGIIVNVTPFEPGWEGYVTLEFSNTTPLPARIYANEGCAQVLFFEGDEQCELTYADRNGGDGGKYQNQEEAVVTPRM